jgi:hypothetical protein
MVMNKIEQIQQAIGKAQQRQSGLSPSAFDVPALASLQIRHLLNNLGALATNYLEIGVHRGGTFCSTIHGNHNLKFAQAIDCFVSDAFGEGAENDFRNNSFLHLPPASTLMNLIVSDAFEVDLSKIDRKFDMYLYDGDHSIQAQKNALLYYKPVLADEFIFCCDDFDWREVHDGTMQGIEEGGYKILLYARLVGNNHDNEGWWNGYGVFLLQKQ